MDTLALLLLEELVDLIVDDFEQLEEAERILLALRLISDAAYLAHRLGCPTATRFI